MTGFFLQNTLAISIGLLVGGIYYFLLPEGDPRVLFTTIACGFLGAHLPNIQQPTLPSYRLIRKASWLASLFVPLTIFFYRPADFIPAWLITILFTSGFWFIIDQISLRRDFTRSTLGIALLPLMVTGCAYVTLGKATILPVFLASSSGYISFLLAEHFLQSRQSRIKPQQIRQKSNENLAS